MLDTLLAPLRLPERAVDALGRVAPDVAALREEISKGLGTLEERTSFLVEHLQLLRTDVAVVRESTSCVPEATARLEKTVDGMGGKLDRLDEAVGTLHGDLTELCAHVEGLGKQLETVAAATSPLQAHAANLDQSTSRLSEQVVSMQETVEGLKGSVEEVTKDLPGSSGSGPVARVRDAVSGQSSR